MYEFILFLRKLILYFVEIVLFYFQVIKQYFGNRKKLIVSAKSIEQTTIILHKYEIVLTIISRRIICHFI